MDMKSQGCFAPLRIRPNRTHKIAAAACLIAVVRWTSMLAAQSAPSIPDPANELRTKVESFLTTDDLKEQANLIKEIDSMANGDIALLESAIKDAQHWKADTAPEGSVTLSNLSTWPADGQPKARYALPDDYSIGRKYPLILALTAKPYAEWSKAANAEFDLPPSIVIVVNPDLGTDIAHGEAWAELQQALLRTSGVMFPIDQDRVFLVADETHAAAGWSMLFSDADRFAGAIVHEGFPDLPYPAQSYALFILNLRHTPVLVKENLPESPPPSDTTDSKPPGSPQLRALEFLAAKDGIPLKVIRTSDREPSIVSWRDEARALFDRARPSKVSLVSHCFTGPLQGSAGWLRASKIAAEPWTAQQVSILPKPDTDGDDFITDFFREHLAHLSGEVTGNTLTLQTHRCAEIEIRLTADMMDWSRPLTVMLNGIKRHDAIVAPSIKTMLNAAREGHLAHPIRAILTFEVHTDAPRRGKKTSSGQATGP